MKHDPFNEDPDFEREWRLRSEVVQQPLRLLAGFFIGLVLGGLAFLLPLRFWPLNDSSVLTFWFPGLLVTPSLVSGAACAALLSLRPLVRWWLLLPVVAASAALGLAAGNSYQEFMSMGCLTGTGPQEAWCSNGPPWTVNLYFSGVAAALGLLFGTLGLRPREPSQERRPRRSR